LPTKRIAVTGMSINTRLGDSLEGFRESLMAGRSGVRRWTVFPTDRVYSKIGGDLSDYDWEAKLAGLEGRIPGDVFRRLRKLVPRAPWTTKLSMLLATDAWIDAGLFEATTDHDAAGVIVSGHNLNALYHYETRQRFEEEPEFIDGLTSLYSLDTDHAASVSEALQTRGPIYTVGGACASGNIALRAAVDEIRHHQVERVIVVGAVLEYAPVDLQAMALIGAITWQSFNDEPERASRPYDTAREGFVPSHGGAALVLEDLDRARARGARIYAELLSVAANSDANHLPQPSEDGQVRVMLRALQEAGVDHSQIDYVNAHATSTPLGDLTEIRSIKRVFGRHARELKINAPKSMLGHTCWSAPAVETVAGILQMKAGMLHRSINVDTLDPEVDLDICRDGNVAHRVNYAMKNSFGFGGINSVSILKNYED
jgi:3-oxoacyl-(acyl-carrier-protein) synthase